VKVCAEGGSFTVQVRASAHGLQDFQVVVFKSALDEPDAASGWLPDWDTLLAQAVHRDWRGRVVAAALAVLDAKRARPAGDPRVLALAARSRWLLTGLPYRVRWMARTSCSLSSPTDGLLIRLTPSSSLPS
jgi:hypothetical protein